MKGFCFLLRIEFAKRWLKQWRLHTTIPLPVAVPKTACRSQRSLRSFDRGHSSRSLLPAPRAVALVPCCGAHNFVARLCRFKILTCCQRSPQAAHHARFSPAEHRRFATRKRICALLALPAPRRAGCGVRHSTREGAAQNVRLLSLSKPAERGLARRPGSAGCRFEGQQKRLRNSKKPHSEW